MSEKIQHTPTPWKCDMTLTISAADGNVGLMNLARSEEVSRANAAHIVRCVNSHAALLAALDILAAYPLEEFGKESKPDSYPLFGANNWGLTVGHVKAARAALATARGKL